MSSVIDYSSHGKFLQTSSKYFHNHAIAKGSNSPRIGHKVNYLPEQFFVADRGSATIVCPTELYYDLLHYFNSGLTRYTLGVYIQPVNITASSCDPKITFFYIHYPNHKPTGVYHEIIFKIRDERCRNFLQQAIKNKQFKLLAAEHLPEALTKSDPEQIRDSSNAIPVEFTKPLQIELLKNALSILEYWEKNQNELSVYQSSQKIVRKKKRRSLKCPVFNCDFLRGSCPHHD